MHASRFLELYDEEFQNQPYLNGICTLAPLEFPESAAPEIAVEQVSKSVGALLEQKKFPIILGGEHSISEGCAKAFAKRFGKDLSILHFDAHADLREEYEFSRHSHACALRRMRDYCKSTVSVGVRSLSKEEAGLIVREKIPVFFKTQLDGEGAKKIAKKIAQALGKKVFVSIDFDAFDPSEMPSVGTPEPNGMRFADAVAIISEVAKTREIVGFDFVELSPIDGLDAPNFFAARLAHKLMALVSRVSSRASPTRFKTH